MISVKNLALLGDTLYGGPALADPGHHLLHASLIRVEGVTVKSNEWEYGRQS